MTSSLHLFRGRQKSNPVTTLRSHEESYKKLPVLHAEAGRTFLVSKPRGRYRLGRCSARERTFTIAAPGHLNQVTGEQYILGHRGAGRTAGRGRWEENTKLHIATICGHAPARAAAAMGETSVLEETESGMKLCNDFWGRWQTMVTHQESSPSF